MPRWPGCASTWGGLDLLVNNAGIATGGRIDVEAISDWERVVDINLLGVARGCHTFTPAAQAAAQRPHRQRRLARRARARPRHGELQRHQGRAWSPSARRCPSSSARGTSTCRWSARRSSAPTCTSRSRARTPRCRRPGCASSPRPRSTPAHIAAIVLKGIDARKKIILTDRLGQRAYLAKRFARPLYDRMLTAQATAARPPGRRRPRRPHAVSGGRPAPPRCATRTPSTSSGSRPGCARTPPARPASTASPRCSSSSAARPTSPTCCGMPVGRHPVDVTSSCAAPRPAPRPGAPTTCAASTTSRRPWPRCSRRAPDGGVLRRRGRHRLAVLRHGAHRGHHPAPRRPARARARPRRGGRPVPHRGRHPGRPARRRRRGGGAGRRSTAATATCAARSTGWCGRYRRARTDDVGDFEATMAWIEAHQPDDLPHVLVHNDFRFDNLVLDPDDPTRIVGVLDWEMATVGDPLMDLGSALAYWVQADDHPAFLAVRRQPTHTPGMLTRAEVVRALRRGPRPRGHPRAVAVLRRVRRLPARRDRPADLLPVPRTARRPTRPTASSVTSSASSTPAAPPSSAAS